MTITLQIMTLDIQQISHRYPKSDTLALKDINLTLHEGEIVGFLGPNGAGKSTLLKILTGYLTPTEGLVKIDGKIMAQDPLTLKHEIGYLPELNPLYTEMYIKEYLLFVDALYFSRKDRAKRLKRILEETGLEAMQNKKIKTLSKGYKQRVGLAQALIHDPKILLLDEPTSGLDPNQLLEIRALIKRLGKNKTVLFSTHIMQEVTALCDRVIVIKEGEIIADKTVEELEETWGEKSSHVILEVEYDKAPDLETLRAIDGLLELTPLPGETPLVHFQIIAHNDIRGELFNHAMAHHLKLLTIKENKPSLETIFHQLTQNS